MVGVSRKVFLIWSVFIVSVAANIYSWVDVPYGDRQAYDIEEHPLYIATYADKGSGQTMGVYLLADDSYRSVTSVQWRFSDYSYIIYYCSYVGRPYSGLQPYVDTNKLTNVPVDRNKIWKISKNDTALTIHCNGVQVLNLVYDDPSLNGECKSKLRQDVKYISFYYNPYSSVPNRYLPAGAYSRWVDVPFNEFIKYDLEGQPLYIKTNTEKGSGEEVRVILRNAQNYLVATVYWRFSDYGYFIGFCSSKYTNKLTNVPEALNKIWKITKGDTALTIHCNGVEVLEYVYADAVVVDGRCTLTTASNVGKIYFPSSVYSPDTAADKYIPAGSKSPTYCDGGYYLDVGTGCVPCLPGTNSAAGNAPSCRDCSDGTQTDYRGYKATTVTGRTCQKWTDQSPFAHTRTPNNYRNAGLGDHNYCRNPDGELGAWCYTTDKYRRWEDCGIERCGG